MKIIYGFILLIIMSCDGREPHYLHRDNFIMLSDVASPDKNHRMLTYQFDTGALGYSRVFWAIIPADADTVKLNLVKFLFPDGYKAKHWLPTGEAVIEKWESYYYKNEEVDLRTGDTYLGVKLVLE